MPKFKIISDFKPTGDQPQAIKKLTEGVERDEKHQVLLGVTGSGKSVVSNTPVFIRNHMNEVSNQNIGEIIDSYLDIFEDQKIVTDGTELISADSLEDKFKLEVYSFNKNSKISSWKPVKQLIRHKSPDKLYKLRTSCGREVVVTGDHNFFVLRSGIMKLVKTTQIGQNDFIPLPLFLEEPESSLKQINFEKYFTQERKVYVSVPMFNSLYLINAVEINSLIGYQKAYAVMSGDRLSYDQYSTLSSRFPQLAEKTIFGVGSKHYETTNKVLLNDSFLRLMGYYIAEGHAEKNYFLISNSEDEIIDDFSRSLKALYKEPKRRPDTYDYVVNNSLWADFFANCLGKNSRLKKMPDFWCQLSNNQLAQILSAYFSADGGINGVEVTCTTVSTQLASDIAYALLRFGIVSRTRRRFVKVPNKKYRSLCFEIHISGQKNLSLYRYYINFTTNRKRQKLDSIISKTFNTNVDVIPMNGLHLENIRTSLGLFQRDIAKACGLSRALISLFESGERYPSRHAFSKICSFLSLKASVSKNVQIIAEIEKLESLLNLFWSPVKSIEEVPGEKFVYDFAVDDNETFLAGNGGLYVHNTFSMANVIQNVQKPTLVISHNKTLAGQLAQEFKTLFPENAVEYFVSYYDYYQPEAYLPSSDTYIEKDAQINDEIEKLRLSTTASLMTRRDVVVVASVSCIYNIGSPVEYGGAILELKAGVKTGFETVLKMLNKMFYTRNDFDFKRSTFRVTGDTIDIYPSYMDRAVRVQFLGDKIEKVSALDPLTGQSAPLIDTQVIYPAKHYVTPEQRITPAMAQIEEDLEKRLFELKKQNKLVEAQRLEQRTHYDLEMIKEFGYCNGIENYSRYFDGRNPGDAPYTLMDYFPKDFLLIIDESHITLPQVRGMYNGDRSRKETLIDFGFRLPSALDNRPLKFEEFQRRINQVIYVSATPDEYELSLAGKDNIAEQLIRPTGIVDPEIIVRPTEGQIDNVISEVQERVKKGERVLITTLTKRMAEDLTEYLQEKEIKVNYLHSDIETLKRSDILQSLRLGEYDVVVGINLLREGLDLPEVSLVVILDADKEGFLRSRTSLIQTMGRAARNTNGRVIMYADKITKSMQEAIEEVERRREYQQTYNKEHHITPKNIEKALRDRLIEKVEEEIGREVVKVDDIPETERQKIIKKLQEEMKQAAELLDFETAAKIRDQIRELS